MREDISGTGKRRKAESLTKSRESGLTPAEKTHGEGGLQLWCPWEALYLKSQI